MSDPINDGGPAFPFVEPATQCGVSPGMTLRDWFAGQALAGMVERDGYMPRGSNTVNTMNRLSHNAYTIADTMLAARERRAGA